MHSSQSPSLFQRFALGTAIALVYLVTARVGLLLASVHGNVSPVWPATGFAIAASVVYGRLSWPAVTVGAFVANAITGVPLWVAGGIALGNTFEAILGARIVSRIRAQSQRLGGFAEVVAWFLGSGGGSAISATCGVVTLWASGPNHTMAASSLWITWWIGDAIGGLIVGPLLVALWEERPIVGGVSLQSLVKLVFLAVIVLVVSYVIGFTELGTAMLFIVFPALFLAVSWFGVVGVRAMAVVFATVAIISATGGRGPFPSESLNASLILLQVFLAAVAITTLLLPVFKASGVFWLPALVLLLGWSLSGWIFYSLERNRIDEDKKRFDRLIDAAREKIQIRLATYIDAMHWASGLHAASNEVTPQEWREYIEFLDLNGRYPGINGMGRIVPVPHRELAQFESVAKATIHRDFRVHSVPGIASAPSVDALAEHFVITNIEPLESNFAALGLDVGSESARRHAAEEARDFAVPRSSERIVLVQDGNRRSGFLVYLPMYKKSAPLRTIEERRAAFVGWIYAPFITENFFSGILSGKFSELDLVVFMGSEPNTAYDSRSAENLPRSASFEKCLPIDLVGTSIQTCWNRSPSFRSTTPAAAVSAATSLALVSILLAGLVLSLKSFGKRASELAVARTSELESANELLRAQIAERERMESQLMEAKESAEAANRAKSDFLAIMSHEVRTPINGVMGMANVLRITRLSAAQQRYVDAIQISADSLLNIVNEILDFSKIEAGKLTFEHIDFELQDLLNEVLQTQAGRAHAKGLELLGYLERGQPTRLRGDPGRLRQVLNNLVNNAIKFTERGEVVVRGACEFETETHVMLRFEVTDTGIGIAESQTWNLFEPFQQADLSTTRKYGGTGLGLAICKRLVELMGGTIGLRSTASIGTVFHFTVLLEKQSVARRRVQPLDPRCADRRILIVDDNATSRQILVAQITEWELPVHSACSSEEAFDLLRGAASAGMPFDLVLLDAEMPEVRGIELAKRIAEDAALSRTKSVLVVGVGSVVDFEPTESSVLADVLHKPITDRALHDCLEAVLLGTPKELSSPIGVRSVPPLAMAQLRILLAEDNTINQQVALAYLDQLGHGADVVSNGREAVEAFVRTTYDVIFMDCMMPELDGYDATLRIRELERQRSLAREPFRPIHIIAMTASAMRGDREKCLAVGMNDYVTKPIKLVELHRALEEWAHETTRTGSVVDRVATERAEPSLPIGLVNFARLADASNGNREVAHQLVALYVELVGSLFGDIESAIENQSSVELHALAHKGCGTSATLGIDGMMPALLELDRIGRMGELDRAGSVLAELKERWVSVKVELDGYLQSV